MGSIGICIPITQSTTEGEALLKALWDQLYAHMKKLVRSKAGRSVLCDYASMEAWDGLNEGSWFASSGTLHLFFGDAAGLCYLEMYLSLHWTTLALYDSWEECQRIAQRFGTQLTPPSSALGAMALSSQGFNQVHFPGDPLPELHLLLNGPNRRIFFSLGSALAYTHCSAEVDLEHEIERAQDSLPLKKLPAKERSRVEKLIRQAQCACEVCERLRKKLSLPLVSPSPPKKSPEKPKTTGASAMGAPLPQLGLAQSKVHRILDLKELKKLDPAKVQILDLHSDAGAKIPAAIFKQLPQLGLLALNLKRNRSFSLPEEVFQCPHLQVLGLNDTYSTARASLNPSLPQLTQLRALDLGMCRFQGAKADEALRLQAQLPELQTLDGYHFCDYFPESFKDLRNLRHLCVAAKKNRWESWRQVPLQSISTHEPVPEFGGGPFEFYEGPLDNYGSDMAQLRFAATFSEADPAPLKGATNLRGLVLSNLRELPTWLEQLSNLEFLEIQHYYSHLKFVTKNFAVLGRLTGLKCLILRVSQNWQVPVDLDELDLSALTELRWLSVNSWSASHPNAPLPKASNDWQTYAIFT